MACRRSRLAWTSELGLLTTTIGEMPYHRTHHRRTNRVANHLNAVAACTGFEFHRRWHPHRGLKLRHLQHPHNVAVLWIRLHQCEAVHSRDRAQRPVQFLPPAGSVGAIVDKKEWSRCPQLSERATRPCECWLGAALLLQGSVSVLAVKINHLFRIPCLSNRGLDFGWHALAVTSDKQTSARLRHPEMHCVQDLLLRVITKLLQLVLEFGVPGPVAHAHDVLNDDPPGLECLRETDNLKSGILALFASRFVSSCRAVAGTFGRGQGKVNAPELLLEPS